jgi:glycosyltransferase involved in cell wall biosynthesis
MSGESSVDKHPIRVLHFADVINRYDFIDNVIRNLSPSQFESEAATLVGEANICPPEYAASGIRHTVLGGRSRRDYPLTAVRLAALLKHREIDILHAHHFDPNALAWLATHLHRATRLVVGRQYSDYIYKYSSGAKRQALLAVEHIVNSHASRVIVPSRRVRDILVHRQGVDATKVDVIPYAFDPSRYPLPTDEQREHRRDDLGIGSRFAVATVGRLNSAKGHQYMLQAILQVRRELPDLVWVLVGDGPDRRELERVIRREDLDDSVHLLGWQMDVPHVMNAMDAVVQPSVEEGFGQVMIEALWMERALVVTNVSGAAELLSDGKDCLLVPTADPTALAEALRALYTDASLCKRLGAEGRKHVEARLSIPAIIPDYERSYLRTASR